MKEAKRKRQSLAAVLRKPVTYRDLNARQKENYNFLKLSAILADYGFVTMRVSADWEGADLIAQHNAEELFLKIQLKSRLTFCQKYVGKDIYIAFRDGSESGAAWYLFPHDEVLKLVLAKKTIIGSSRSWLKKKAYSCGRVSRTMKPLLARYRLPPGDHSS